ncbi:hypothetical protein F4779DRAFT_574383, partial [Xylariaceae sp. FL0662B]
MSPITSKQDTPNYALHHALHHAEVARPILQRSLSDPFAGVQGTLSPSMPEQQESSVIATAGDNTTPNVPAPQQEYVIQHMFTGLKVAWREIIERRSMILGSPASFNTRFEPDITDIRDKAIQSSATLRDIADATESAMLELWKESCKRVIRKYSIEMRQDIVREAKNKAEAVRERVVARATDPEFQIPLTQEEDDVEALRPTIEKLTLEENIPKTPPRTPRNNLRATNLSPLPKGLTSPRLRYSMRTQPPTTPTIATAMRLTPIKREASTSNGYNKMEHNKRHRVISPVKDGYEVVGHIGRYPVLSPTKSTRGGSVILGD